MLIKFSTDLFKPNSCCWEGPKFLTGKMYRTFLVQTIKLKNEPNELKTTDVNITTNNLYCISHIINIEN